MRATTNRPVFLITSPKRLWNSLFLLPSLFSFFLFFVFSSATALANSASPWVSPWMPRGSNFLVMKTNLGKELGNGSRIPLASINSVIRHRRQRRIFDPASRFLIVLNDIRLRSVTRLCTGGCDLNARKWKWKERERDEIYPCLAVKIGKISAVDSYFLSLRILKCLKIHRSRIEKFRSQ